MATDVSEYPGRRRTARAGWGRSAMVLAGFSAVSTVTSLFAPYFTSRLPPYICFGASVVVSYAMVLLGVLFAVLGIVFDPKDTIAVRALSVNLFMAALPLVAFVVFVVLHH